MNLFSRLRRLWIINYLGLLIVSACTPTSSQGLLFTSKEGNFSILMPGAILEETNSPVKGITSRNWSSIKKESIYTVADVKLPKKIAPDRLQKFLQLLINAAIKTNFIKGKKISQTAVNKNGYKCQDFSLTGKPSSYIIGEAKKKGLTIKSKLFYQRSLLCIKDNHAIEAVVFTPSPEELKTNGASFIKSFNLKS
ncbi:hypothetical protein [Anabaena azotica]|uniref:hypothetical protein n=1 Tax=Anabaena azotica TaxID=197653 RepID=UPI0039A54502